MFRLFLGLIFLGVTSISRAEIRRTSSLDSIEREIAKSSSETLVLLDVGGTLISNHDALFHPAHEAWKQQWFQKHCAHMPKEEKALLLNIVESNFLKSNLATNPRWPQLIQKAQENGVKVVAFTRVFNIDPTRPEKLHDIGFSFKDDLPGLKSGISFNYSKGVIQTEARLKGPVLNEIIPYLRPSPMKIIFVDDRMEQIKSVNDVCYENGIACLAFHYTVFEKAPPLDEKIADYQLSTLVQEHRWLTENEAKMELNKVAEEKKAAEEKSKKAKETKSLR